MSEFFLYTALFFAAVLVFFSYRIFASANSSAGIFSAYRQALHLFYKEGKFDEGMDAGLHYLALHLLFPCAGFAFFLRTDANFLVLILSAVWSVQLLQRVFPGLPEEN